MGLPMGAYSELSGFPETSWKDLSVSLLVFISHLRFHMTAIGYSLVGETTRESELAIIFAFSLAGLVLSLACACFGFDVGTSIPG